MAATAPTILALFNSLWPPVHEIFNHFQILNKWLPSLNILNHSKTCGRSRTSFIQSVFSVFLMFIYTCFPNFSTKFMFAHCSTTRKKTQLMCYGQTDCGILFTNAWWPLQIYATKLTAWYHQFQNFTVLPHTYSSSSTAVLLHEINMCSYSTTTQEYGVNLICVGVHN
jgi:hypothetical protein